MAGVKVTVAVVEAPVEGIVQGRAAVFADVIQSMCPSVSNRATQVVPVVRSQLSLQRAVVGRTSAADLVHGTELRVPRIERQSHAGCTAAVLIEVADQAELAP